MNQLLRPSDLLAPQQTFAFPSRRDPHPRGSRGITVNVTDIHKSFGDQHVLKGIDLVVPAGQFIAIVGRSGCGKSTLLRLIAGLERAETGSIDLDGDRRGDKSHGVRFMFQEPRLLPWARVRDNVKVGLGRGVDPGEASTRAAGALQEVGLTDKAGQWPSVLSGGQRQRVALARALVSQPDLLLFDEPLGALDALTRITMQELLARVWTEQGFTAVLVTHDVQEAVALADRILVIEDGQIAQDVTIDLPRPRRRGDAEFAALEGDILARLMTGIA